MEQQIENHIFCKEHDDYTIDVVCLNYQTEDVLFMCKKCHKIKKKHLTQKNDDELKKNQEQFEIEFQNLSKDLDDIKKIKIENIKAKLTKIIENGLTKILENFKEAITSISQIIETINSSNHQEKQQKLKNQLSSNTFKDLKVNSIPNKVNILQNIKNELFDEIYNLEKEIFSDHLLGQKLYEIPSLKDIFNNFDTNNLLMTFEQNYSQKQQFLTQRDLEDIQQQLNRDKESLKQESQQLNENLRQQYIKIENELNQQKEKMLARFRKYDKWFKDSSEIIARKRENLQNKNEEIQIMTKNEFYNLQQLNLLNQKHKNIIQVLKETGSKICHLGQYDVKVSFNQIESEFLVKLIPIEMLYNYEEINNNFLSRFPNATEINGANLNKNGNIEGRAIIREQQEDIIVEISQDEKQEGPSISKFNNRSLFNLDLSTFFPNRNNIFNYIKKNLNGLYTYEEKNKWILTQNGVGLKAWSLTIYQNQNPDQMKLDIQNIIINSNGQIDEQQDVIIKNFQENYEYEGQINNSFQYQGQGKLKQNDLIKEGTWKDGKLEGKGKLTQNDLVKEGTWKDGKLEGKGKITQKGETIYEGDFKNDMKNGRGTELLFQQQYYRGEFRNDLKHGSGDIVRKAQDGQEIIMEKDTKWQDGQNLDNVCQIF